MGPRSPMTDQGTRSDVVLGRAQGARGSGLVLPGSDRPTGLGSVYWSRHSLLSLGASSRAWAEPLAHMTSWSLGFPPPPPSTEAMGVTGLAC